MNFINALEQKLNTTETQNGAKAYESTLSKCLDLFGKIGACRDDLDQADRLFSLAFDDDPETATRILFWVRDIRGGQGERSVFRKLLVTLAKKNPELCSKLIEYVPVYGRWDDLWTLENTDVWDDVLTLVKTQFHKDIFPETPVSLLAKWLPSINASSKDSKRIGRKIAASLGLSEREYRNCLTNLRTRIKIVEQKMCSNRWKEIEYEHVPSRASFMYRNAFNKRDAARYKAYLDAVKRGEKKINAGTLYPYDIVQQYLLGTETNNATLELQWEALPNYMEDKEFNGLVVADVSGSMTVNNSLPMAVSISLAMYIAERNVSEIWKDKFITFSGNPKIQTVTGSDIESRIKNLMKAEWGFNTDLIAVFKVILDTAIENSLDQCDMPQKLIIVSDMEFDAAVWSNDETNFEAIQSLYHEVGYEMPALVFWDVNSGGTVPIKVDDMGVCLVSGCSPSILQTVLGDNISPIDVMNSTVYSDRYSQISTAFR